MIAAWPDLLRIALLPAFIWVAVLDIRTRRVPRWIWWPLGAVGVLALIWSAIELIEIGGVSLQLWTIRVAISLGIIAPLGYLFHRFGAFGGADAKAVIVIAIAFPTYPILTLGGVDLPLVQSDVGVLSLTILVNAVLLGLCYPIGLALFNTLHGRFRPAMFIGHPVHWSSLESRHGVLLEQTGGMTRRGLDLDALRMYLRWRESDLATIRNDPSAYADPTTIPDAPASPGDGRVRTDGGTDSNDRWAAAAFLADTDGAYGTRPETLRDALDLLCERDVIWISPGIPFLVPLVAGVLIGITYGDMLTALGSLFGV